MAAVSRDILTTPPGSPCALSFNNVDVFGNVKFQVSQPVGAQSWNCLVVDRSNLIPTQSGNQSVRIEVRPGDCSGKISATNSDCSNDRSRFELLALPSQSTQGQELTYTYYIYLPAQPLIRPAQKGGASSTLPTLQMFVGQINWMNLTGTSYGTLVYTAVDQTGALVLIPTVGFSWLNDKPVTIDSNPTNKWIKLAFVIKSTAANDGYLRVYANNQLILNQTRATLPVDSDYRNDLKVGIYNAYLSSAATPYDTQVIFFDDFTTQVQNF
jgi:hypothetical protein